VAELLQAGCPFCHPAKSIKALKDDGVPNQGQHASTSCCQDRLGALWWLDGLPWHLASREQCSCVSDSVADFEKE